MYYIKSTTTSIIRSIIKNIYFIEVKKKKTSSFTDVQGTCNIVYISGVECDPLVHV